MLGTIKPLVPLGLPSQQEDFSITLLWKCWRIGTCISGSLQDISWALLTFGGDILGGGGRYVGG